MEKDPVCGMTVDPNKAAAQTSYWGRTYYFCSQGCRQEFEKAPDRYHGAAQKASTHRR